MDLMDDFLKCKICDDKDHEGIYFHCRCEDRNIRISKERRRLFTHLKWGEPMPLFPNETSIAEG